MDRWTEWIGGEGEKREKEKGRRESFIFIMKGKEAINLRENKGLSTWKGLERGNGRGK